MTGVDQIHDQGGGGAIISECRLYRYLLWRRIQDQPRTRRVLFVLLNPSTADALVDDHTVRKGMGFCRKWGAGVMLFANLFALRSTDPNELLRAFEPVGRDNDATFKDLFARDDKLWRVVCAWGSHKAVSRHQKRVDAFTALAKACKRDLYCLGANDDGNPKHILMLPYATEMTLWRAA